MNNFSPTTFWRSAGSLHLQPLARSRSSVYLQNKRQVKSEANNRRHVASTHPEKCLSCLPGALRQPAHCGIRSFALAVFRNKKEKQERVPEKKEG